MKKKQSSKHYKSGNIDNLPESNDFYTGAPTERPLYQVRREADRMRVRKTGRHQAVRGRRKEATDLREKMALVAILKAGILLMVLVICFFALWKGIGIYEEKLFDERQPAVEVSQVLTHLQGAASADASTTAEVSFAERVEMWKKAERLVGTVDNLLLRGNVEQAIQRCNEALEVDPTHMETLKRLGSIYFDQGMYVEAINTYIRLLSVEPSDPGLQIELLKALNAYGDSEAMIAVALWYNEQNSFNTLVHHYLANAYFAQENYPEAIKAYERVLVDEPEDIESLNNLSIAYMQQEEYKKAVDTLDTLSIVDLRNPDCYKRMSFCYAQLGKEESVVQTLGKSAHLFGPNVVAQWIQDKKLDPVRMERSFQIFADSVVTEEYRKYLERMAKTMEQSDEPEIDPQLELPKNEIVEPELLRNRQ